MGHKCAKKAALRFVILKLTLFVVATQDGQTQLCDRLVHSLGGDVYSILNHLHSSGETNLQICHGIALELHCNNAIPIKFQDIFSGFSESNKETILLYCRVLIYLNYL